MTPVESYHLYLGKRDKHSRPCLDFLPFSPLSKTVAPIASRYYTNSPLPILRSNHHSLLINLPQIQIHRPSKLQLKRQTHPRNHNLRPIPLSSQVLLDPHTKHSASSSMLCSRRNPQNQQSPQQDLEETLSRISLGIDDSSSHNTGTPVGL